MSEDATDQVDAKDNATSQTFQRDERGLITVVNYVFKKDGRVDWRAMVNPKYLAINKQYEEEIVKKYAKSLPELSVSEVDDKYLIILLNGIKEIATLRGYHSVTPEVKYVNEAHTTVQTTITWIGNFETNNLPVTFGDVGGATKENTQGFSQIYLDAIASNRAFVRAVRNYLGIGIVGHDELSEGHGVVAEGESTPALNPVLPHGMLNKNAEKHGMNFDKLKEFAQEEELKKKIEGKPEEWKVITDISPRDCMTIISALMKIKKK